MAERTADLSRVNTALEREITERKRAEGELNQFFFLSLDMLCISGFDGYFKRLNPAWETTLGFVNTELLAQPYLDFVHPDDREATIAEAQKLSNGVDPHGHTPSLGKLERIANQVDEDLLALDRVGLDRGDDRGQVGVQGHVALPGLGLKLFEELPY